jgi:hypothetical protein
MKKNDPSKPSNTVLAFEAGQHRKIEKQLANFTKELLIEKKNFKQSNDKLEEASLIKHRKKKTSKTDIKPNVKAKKKLSKKTKVKPKPTPKPKQSPPTLSIVS